MAAREKISKSLFLVWIDLVFCPINLVLFEFINLITRWVWHYKSISCRHFWLRASTNRFRAVISCEIKWEMTIKCCFFHDGPRPEIKLLLIYVQSWHDTTWHGTINVHSAAMKIFFVHNLTLNSIWPILARQKSKVFSDSSRFSIFVPFFRYHFGRLSVHVW